MDKIDLDAIIVTYGDKNSHKQINPEDWQTTVDCMKEAIHQALVLASEKADIHVVGETKEGKEEYDVKEDYMCSMSTCRNYNINKQSILDVAKLIV